VSGKNENPKADLILDLARALVCSTDYLLGLSNAPGAAPATLALDPRTVEVLQRVPADRQETVRRMLEGVAEPASETPPRPATKRKPRK
jgi:hypothetical protein